MNLLNKLATFFPAHGVRESFSDWPSAARSVERFPTLLEGLPPTMDEAIEAAVLKYRATLRNYECCLILKMKADSSALDLGKIEIAEAVLRSRGICSYINDSKIRMAVAALERAGETQPIPRPAIPQWLRWKVYRRDHYKCVECGRHWNLSCDHKIPYSKGGQTTFENLQTLCGNCNSKKGAS